VVQRNTPSCQIAVSRGHLCAVEALLESGANPRQVVEEDGRTLLDFAEHAARQEGASAAVVQIKQVPRCSSLARVQSSEFMIALS
jgi:ankyrin repeat protein